jgi:thioredoxin reductase (NADPH)
MPETQTIPAQDVSPQPIFLEASAADTIIQESLAFPTLDATDLASIAPLAETVTFEDGQVIFKAGQMDLDLFIVETGAIEILNPSDGNKHVAKHLPGGFAGDIDLLTHRPVIVTGIARGKTKLLKVCNSRLREVLNKVPRISEKILVAIQERRRLLSKTAAIGHRVVGPGKCRDTMLVREFLSKNFVPYIWRDSASEDGKRLLIEWGSPKKSPVIECVGGKLLINPDLQELARCAGVWPHIPEELADLAVIGAGPAGMAAAVYAASEGLSTVVIDRLGPGGQAASSSKIENFIGFPSGLSGSELATRSVLQMLKFGARMLAPVNVDRIEPAAKPGDLHGIVLDCGHVIRAKTILVAGGVRWRKLDAPGAERFEAAGIHYACTSVEAMLYDTLDVAVVGAGNSAGQAAMFLADCCRDRKVHLLIRRRLGPAMSEYLVNRIRNSANIVVHEGVEISSVQGDRRLESVTLRKFNADGNAADNVADRVETPTNGEPVETLQIGAAFVFIGAEPGCSWLPEKIARDKLGYILTGTAALQSGQWPLIDREPCPLETTLPGILAAGDIRAGSTKRVGFAVGDGSLAVTCVHRLTAIRN